MLIELEIYVLNGEIELGSGNYNAIGWKYNLLSKQWKKLDGYEKILNYFF